jgi:citronellyl-CoA dehydrogenase
MMFFELNDEQKRFQKKVREVYEREVAPLVDEYERKETFPLPLFPALGAERLLCLRFPEKYGEPCSEIPS